MPNATVKTFDTGLSDITPIKYYGIAYSSTSLNVWSLPCPRQVTAQGIYLWVNSGTTYTIAIDCGANRSDYNGYVTIEYTKTTD